MPTTPSRARRWIKSGKATPFSKKGMFCVRLNAEPSARKTQPIAVGIDPGSKKEGFTVKSRATTYLNIQADTPPWVNEKVKTGPNKGKNKTTLRRTQMRRGRRYRKTPYRKCRSRFSGGSFPPKHCAPNRNIRKQWMSPSTRSRWELKLNICKWLSQIFPITDFVVEDVKAITKKKAKKWNLSFSPLEVGKQWFYYQLSRIATVALVEGIQTYEMRETLGLKKTNKKLADVFEAHCVDSWVLAHHLVGGNSVPDNTQVLLITPHNFCRRQLYRFKAKKGVGRTRYGGTMCAGFKKGSLVRHPKYGLCYVSGWMESPTKKEPERKVLSLYSLATGKRLTQNALLTDCRFVSYSSWRTRYARTLPPTRGYNCHQGEGNLYHTIEMRNYTKFK